MKLISISIACMLCLNNFAIAESANFKGTWEEYSKLPGGNYSKNPTKPIPYKKGTIPDLRGRNYYSDYFKKDNPELKNIEIVVIERKSNPVFPKGFIGFQRPLPGNKVRDGEIIEIMIFDGPGK